MSVEFRVRVCRVYLDRQGYSRAHRAVPRGQYFGVGGPVYWYEVLDHAGRETASGCVRAPDKSGAVLAARRICGIPDSEV